MYGRMLSGAGSSQCPVHDKHIFYILYTLAGGNMLLPQFV